MASQLVQMDYEVMEQTAKGFTTAKEMVEAVAKAMIAVIDFLKATTFFNPPLIIVYILWQQNIKTKSEKLAKKLEEITGDLRQAVVFHKNGDVAGGRFFQGTS